MINGNRLGSATLLGVRAVCLFELLALSFFWLKYGKWRTNLAEAAVLENVPYLLVNQSLFVKYDNHGYYNKKWQNDP